MSKYSVEYGYDCGSVHRNIQICVYLECAEHSHIPVSECIRSRTLL